jgi:hypothetical protein
MRAGILSGPVSLDVYRLDRQFDTSSTDSSISEISVTDVLGREGILGAVLDVVNTERKYILKRSAFSPGVFAVCPLYVMTDSIPER